MAVLQWIQDLPISVAIAESESLWWGYAWWLFIHAVGMGLTAGLGFVICLRLLGVGRQIPVSSFRILFRVFWIGFYINLLSGTILFMTDATGIARRVGAVRQACLSWPRAGRDVAAASFHRQRP